MTANRRSAQWPLGLVDTNGNRLNQARVIVNPRESHSRSFDQRLRARAPFTARNRRFVDSPLEGTGFEPSVPREAPGILVVSVLVPADFSGRRLWPQTDLGADLDARCHPEPRTSRRC